MEQAEAILDALESAEKKAGAAATEMATAVDTAAAEVEGAVSGIAASAGELDAAAASAGAAGTEAMAGAGAAATAAGASAEEGAEKGVGAFAKFGLAAGAAGVGFAVVATKMGVEWQDTMTTLATSASIPEGAADKIGAAITGISDKTTFSATTMAEGLSSVAGQWEQYTGQALNAQQSTSLVSAAAEEAQVTHSDFSSTLQGLVGTMTAFHEPASAVNTVMDDLYNTSKKTGQSVPDLTNAMDKLEAKTSGVKPSLQDVSALTVALAQHGLTGSKGVAAMSTAFTTLTNGSTTTTKELDSLGVKLTDSHGKFLGMSDVIKELNGKYQDLSPQQQAFASYTLFGAGAASQMTQIIDAGSEPFNKLSESVGEAGTVQDAYKDSQKDLGVQMDELKNQATNLTREFGTYLVEGIIKVEQIAGPTFEKFKSGVENVFNFISQHKGPILAALVGIGTAVLIEVVPPMLVWASAALAAAAAMIIAAAPFVGMAAAIALLSIGIYELITHFHEIVAAVKQAWDDVLEVIQTAVTTVLDFLQSHWQLIVAILTGPIGAAVLLIIDNWSKIKAATQAAWDAIKALITGALSAITGTLSAAWSAIQAAATTAWDAVKTLFTTTWDAIKTTVTTVTSAISTTITTFLTAIQTAFTTAWDAIQTTVSTVIDAISGTISSTLSTIEGVLSGAWSTIQSVASGAWSTVESTIANIMSTLYDDVSSFGEDIVGYFAGLPGEILSAIGDLGSLLYHAGASLIQGLIDGINSMIDKIPGGSMVTSALGKIGGFFAEGGPVGANIPIIVGEKGPEMFIPNTTGMIVPNRVLTMPQAPAMAGSYASGSSGTSVTNYFNVVAANPQDFADQVSRIMKNNIFTGIRVP